MVWEYLPVAKPPHASPLKHCGIAPSNGSWHVLQYVALVDSGEKSSSTSMSLGEPQRKNERLITLTTYEIHRLESSSIPTPYRKQKTSIQNALLTGTISLPIAMQPFLWTLPRGRIVAIFPVTCRRCFAIRLTGKSFFFEIRNACILFSSPIIYALFRVLSLKNGPSPKIT